VFRSVSLFAVACFVVLFAGQTARAEQVRFEDSSFPISELAAKLNLKADHQLSQKNVLSIYSLRSGRSTLEITVDFEQGATQIVLYDGFGAVHDPLFLAQEYLSYITQQRFLAQKLHHAEFNFVNSAQVLKKREGVWVVAEGQGQGQGASLLTIRKLGPLMIFQGLSDTNEPAEWFFIY
jgi:hypothetical protein